MGRAGLLIAPYGSDLVAEAAGWAASKGRVLWNHDGNADDVQRLPGLVSIGSLASFYLGPVLEALTEHLPDARVMVAAGRGGFGRSAARGAQEAAERLGVRVVGVVAHREVPEAPDADILLAAGSFEDDLALVPRLQVRPAAVAAVGGRDERVRCRAGAAGRRGAGTFAVGGASALPRRRRTQAGGGRSKPPGGRRRNARGGGWGADTLTTRPPRPMPRG